MIFLLLSVLFLLFHKIIDTIYVTLLVNSRNAFDASNICKWYSLFVKCLVHRIAVIHHYEMNCYVLIGYLDDVRIRCLCSESCCYDRVSYLSSCRSVCAGILTCRLEIVILVAASFLTFSVAATPLHTVLYYCCWKFGNFDRSSVPYHCRCNWKL